MSMSKNYATVRPIGGDELRGILNDPRTIDLRGIRDPGELASKILGHLQTMHSEQDTLEHQLALFRKDHPEAIVFYRRGDFLEAFGDDALRASGLLGLTITYRNRVYKDSNDPEKKQQEYMPMCGFPLSTIQEQMGKLKGTEHTIAIAEPIPDNKDRPCGPTQ